MSSSPVFDLNKRIENLEEEIKNLEDYCRDVKMIIDSKTKEIEQLKTTKST